jgi:lipopolysaccharide assembly outer membrane protein LptD (OstA)
MIKNICFISALVFSTISFANEPSSKKSFKFKADKYSTNLDTGITRAEGSVKVWIGDQSIVAQKLEYNPQAGQMRASGEVTVSQPDMTITGTMVDANTDTGFGTYQDAIMRYGAQFSVEAKELAYYANNKFRADYAKISACLDCPQSWSVTGSLVDIEVEGFAKIHHAMVMIKDVPIAYFPVFYIPVKSKRQSGFLVPQMMFGGELGSGVIFPYFWAISDESDATLRYDYYQNAGNRAWTEWRYLRSDRTRLDLVSSYNSNLGIRPVEEKYRYGVSLSQRAQLSEGWVQRLNSEVASDPRYTYHFAPDFKSARSPTLPTDLSFVWQNKTYFLETKANLSQDNVERSASAPDTEYGPIHVLPYVVFTAPAQSLGLGVYTDLKAESLSLRRQNRDGAQDSGLDSQAAAPWIRTGDRFTTSASIYRPSSLGWMSYQPELNIRFDQYRLIGDLDDRISPQYSSVTATPSRLNWNLKQSFESSVFKIFEIEIAELQAVRHSFTPLVTWSYAPEEYRNSHPFFDDEGAPRFDVFDPNSDAAQDGSVDVLAERTLKPHNLVFFGFRTGLTGRFGIDSPRYEQFFSLSALQAYNVDSELFEDLSINLSAYRYGFRVTSSVNIDWLEQKENYRNVIRYDNSFFGVSAVQIITDVPEDSGLSKFEEYQFGLSFKRLGPVQLSGWISYDGLLKRDKEQNYKVTYLSSSKCWFFTMGVNRRQAIGSGSFEYTPYVGVVFSESGDNFLPF